MNSIVALLGKVLYTLEEIKNAVPVQASRNLDLGMLTSENPNEAKTGLFDSQHFQR